MLFLSKISIFQMIRKLEPCEEKIFMHGSEGEFSCEANSYPKSREFKEKDLKLVIHKQSEGSETLLLPLKTGLSETNKKDSELVIKKRCLQLSEVS